MKEDKVNHPKHYTSHPSGVECIDITKHYCFEVGNSIKYLWRCGLKQEEGMTSSEKEIEDLEKAKWYIDSRIKTLKGIPDLNNIHKKNIKKLIDILDNILTYHNNNIILKNPISISTDFIIKIQKDENGIIQIYYKESLDDRYTCSDDISAFSYDELYIIIKTILNYE